MLQFYDHPFSIVPWRVRIALHEKQVTFDTIDINLYTKPPTDEFLALNPFAQIPVLVDGDTVISESIAILEYLEEKLPTPALLPESAEDRARTRQLLCWGTDYWPPAWKLWMAPRLPQELTGPWTEESVAEGKAMICQHLDVLEKELGDREWLVGDFSLADIGYAPFVLVLDDVELGDEVEKRPAIANWVTRLKQRPSVIASNRLSELG